MDQDLFDRRRAIERERVGGESPAGVVTPDIRGVLGALPHRPGGRTAQRPRRRRSGRRGVGRVTDPPPRAAPPHRARRQRSRRRDADGRHRPERPGAVGQRPVLAPAAGPGRRADPRRSLGRAGRRHQRHRHGPRHRPAGGCLRHRALVRTGHGLGLLLGAGARRRWRRWPRSSISARRGIGRTRSRWAPSGRWPG